MKTDGSLPATGPPVGPTSRPIPREHGAWGLLFQPFLAGAILARQWDWNLLPAALMIFLGFLVREPLVVLARQAFVWRTAKAETPQAARWLALELAGFVFCIALLANRIPLRVLGLFLASGCLLTAAAVWITLRNRQRSVEFQCASAALLSTTALVSVYVATGGLSRWAVLLWLALTAHAVAFVLVVHTRLEARIATKSGKPPSPALRKKAWFVALTAAILLPVGHLSLLLPAAFTLVCLWTELRRIDEPDGLTEPLTRVGLRTLLISLVHMTAVIAALWRAVPAYRG